MLREEFEKAKAVRVLTGAGIPALQTGGAAIWKGMQFEQISQARTVKENLDAVWE